MTAPGSTEPGAGPGSSRDRSVGGRLLEFGKPLDVLYLGAGVAIFIGALTVYLRFGSSRNRD